jgi:hypothetical protein
MTLDQFIKSQWRNAWIHEGDLELYVRRTSGGFEEKWGHYQLANMSALTPGNGSLTRFLNKYEQQYQFYIENILDKRLVSFFERRGYVVANKLDIEYYQAPPCMLGPKPEKENG